MNLYESSFFFIGDSGSGKTMLAGAFPKPYFFDFDKGMATHAGKEGIEYDTFKDAPHKSKSVFPDRGIYEYGKGWGEFIKRLGDIGALIDKGEWPYQTLVFDSATMMSTLMMNAILKEDSAGGKPPQLQHYNTESSKLKEIFDAITAWPLIKIVTAHIQRNTNELLNTMEMLPLLTGKFAARSSIYFDEVYYIEATTEKKGSEQVRKHVLRTQSNGTMKQARSRFGIPDGTEATWTAIEAAAKKNALIKIR